jgi:pimeloyl-ACP methyl ester carboxylesterase
MPDTNLLPAYQFLKLKTGPDIAYLDAGPEKAPVLLFLHGLGDTARIWTFPIKELQKTYRCLAIDLPGHGHSGTTNFNYQMYAYAAVVSEFMDVLQLTSLTLAGHLMGGQIGIILALQIPARIEKLVLVAPAGFERFTEAEKKMMAFGATYSNGWNGGGGNDTIEKVAQRQTAMQRSLEGMLAEPIFDYLPQLNMPALVIFGEQDAFIPNRYLHPVSTASVARAGASQIPNAELHLFPRCGHYPQAEQPEHFNRTLQFFLKKGRRF